MGAPSPDDFLGIVQFAEDARTVAAFTTWSLVTRWEDYLTARQVPTKEEAVHAARRILERRHPG